MGEGKQTPVDIRQEQADRIDNQIDVLGKAFLAQTIACARCHDHKFDAISTRDYYALAGYLQELALSAGVPRSARAHRGASCASWPSCESEISDWSVRRAADGGSSRRRRSSRYLLAARQGEPPTPKTNLEQVAAALGSNRRSAAGRAGPKALRAKELKSDRSSAVRLGARLLRRFAELRTARCRQSSRSYAARSRTSAELLARRLVRNRAMPSAHGPAQRRRSRLCGDRPERPIARLVDRRARQRPALRPAARRAALALVHDRQAVRSLPRWPAAHARVNLVIDGYTLIMNPMYGKLTIEPDEQLAWRTMPVDRWVGHRAFIEVSDSTIPMHGLNPPPSTGPRAGRTAGRLRRAWSRSSSPTIPSRRLSPAG